MLRIYALSKCRFFLKPLACLIVILSALSVQELAAQTKSPAPSIPSEWTPHGQPFLSLLDDVTIETKPYAEGYFSFAAQCQLNAPNETKSHIVSEAPAGQSETEDEWAALLTYTCNDNGCSDCSTLTFTNSPKSCGIGCSAHPNSSCPTNCDSCVNASIQQSSESYSKQVSKLLATTLDGSQASFETKTEAIETAMQMVVDKTLADSEIQINELRISHQKEVGQLQEQLLAAKEQTESVDQILAWLRPIYTNQNRNYQQLQQLRADRSELVVRCLLPVTKAKSVIDRTLLPSSAQMASKTLAETRDAELKRLKQEIEVINARLSKLVQEPVRPAQHLEPVYVPQGKLVPIPTLPKRHSALRRLDPNQRLDRIR